MGDLRSELESFGNDDSVESHKEKAVEALKRMESWNLFSETPYEVYFWAGYICYYLNVYNGFLFMMYAK